LSLAFPLRLHFALLPGPPTLTYPQSLFAAGGGGTSDIDTPASAPVYQLKGRGKKRGREPEEAGGMSEGDQAEEAADADAVWEAAENAYHLDLVNLLRQPRMYRALGLSGPPHCIRHSSLEERLNNMQLML